MRLLCFALSLCSAVSFASDWKIFGELEVGYKVNETRSPYYEFCRWPATVSLGVEKRSGTAWGIRHVSNYDCGSPLNNKKEYIADQIFFRTKFWGFK